MKIKFTYNKKIDNKCWKRYMSFIRKNKTVWGISREVKQIIEIKKAEFSVDLSEITEKYKKFFGFEVPLRGYIITTPFSMINDDGRIGKEGIIYYLIYTQNPSVVMAHEVFHIYFEKYTKRNIRNYEESKEYFTVLMNDIFGSNVSGGYPKHQEQREKIFKVWEKTRSLDECISIYGNK